MAAIWPKILTDRIRSGEWSELPLSAQALFPVYCICAGTEGDSWYDKAKLLTMTGLSVRGFQEANRELVRRGWIRREWDGDFTHAAVTTILPIRPKTSAPDALGVAHQNVGGSAPDARGVAHQMPQTSAPDAPQDITGTITEKHNNKQGGEAAGVVCDFLLSKGVWKKQALAHEAAGVTLAQAKETWRQILDDRLPNKQARAAALNYRLGQGASAGEPVDDAADIPFGKPGEFPESMDNVPTTRFAPDGTMKTYLISHDAAGHEVMREIQENPQPPLPPTAPCVSVEERTFEAYRARIQAKMEAEKTKPVNPPSGQEAIKAATAYVTAPNKNNKIKAAAVLGVLAKASSDTAALAAYRKATGEQEGER